MRRRSDVVARGQAKLFVGVLQPQVLVHGHRAIRHWLGGVNNGGRRGRRRLVLQALNVLRCAIVCNVRQRVEQA